MKTAERILVTSLALFNQRGEGNVSSVDIAVELDISPGNLYYHFKGKEVIVAALFDLHRSKLEQVLQAGQQHDFSVEDVFYFLYLVLEQGWLFRFIYHNPTDLLSKYPSVVKPFKRLINHLEEQVGAILSALTNRGQLAADLQQRQQLQQLIGLVFTQSANYYSHKGVALDEQDSLYQSLSLILFAVLPYIRLAENDLIHLQDAIATHNLTASLPVDES